MSLVGVCHAQSLATLWDMARQSEPAYRVAMTSLDAARARGDQAMGALLPQLTATVNTTGNDRKYFTRGTDISPQKDRYNSHSAQLNLTQPLWNYANFAGWRQSESVVAQAEQQLAAAEQDLLAKLVGAWLDVLAARDAVLHMREQAVAAQQQWEVTRRGGELGVHGLPQVEEALAKYDQAQADAMAAEMEAEVKRATLEQLVGSLAVFRPPSMRESAELADLRGESLEKWLATVEASNPAYLAALQAVEAAQAEVRKQAGGHLPTLELVGSYGRNSQAVGGFPGQAGYEIKQANVGVQLNIPIFSGGQQWGKVKEAMAQLEKARQDAEAARRTAIFSLKQAWFGWRSAHARAKAGAQAGKASELALALATRGRARGLKHELDVLQAEQQLRAAQRDHAKGRYDQVASYVKMKSVAGLLTNEDVVALDLLFASGEPGGRPGSEPAAHEPAIRGGVPPEPTPRSNAVSAQVPSATGGEAPALPVQPLEPLAADLAVPPLLVEPSAPTQARMPDVASDEAAVVPNASEMESVAEMPTAAQDAETTGTAPREVEPIAAETPDVAGLPAGTSAPEAETKSDDPRSPVDRSTADESGPTEQLALGGDAVASGSTEYSPWSPKE